MESKLSYCLKLKLLALVLMCGWRVSKIKWSVSWKDHFLIPMRIWTLTFPMFQKTLRNCQSLKRKDSSESAESALKYLKHGSRNGPAKAPSFAPRYGSPRKSTQYSKEQSSDCIRSLKTKIPSYWCTRQATESFHQMMIATTINQCSSTMTIS